MRQDQTQSQGLKDNRPSIAVINEQDQPLQAQMLNDKDKVDRFLADVMRAVLAHQPAPPWPSEWIAKAMLDTVAARAGFHGIAVLLGSTADTLQGWPQPVAAAVCEEMRLAGLWEATHLERLVDLLDRLARSGIKAMVMKGTALAYRHYADPAARRRGDTDLLIRPADRQRTRMVLQQAGFYRRDDPHGLNFQETWLIDCGGVIVHSIDLHWEPADRPVIQKLLRADRLWAKCVPLPRLSPHVCTPDPVIMLVHGAINQAWHEARGFNVDDGRVFGIKRLIWAVDYLRITADFSSDQWYELAELCEQHDAAALVEAALTGAKRDLGLDVPPDVMERLARAAPHSPTYAYIVRRGVLRQFMSDFAATRSIAVRAQLLSSLAFAPRSHLLRKYPHLAHWPTVLLQLRRYAGVLRWLGKRSVKG